MTLGQQRGLTDIYHMPDYTPEVFKRISLATTGIIPRAYQIQNIWPIIDSVIHQKGYTFYLKWPRQTGKSTTISEAASQIAAVIPSFYGKKYKHLAKGVSISSYAPNADKARLLTEKITERLSSWFYKDVFDIKVDINNARRFKISNGSRISTASASPTSVCSEGDTIDLGLIDEAQGVMDHKILKSIRPQLSAVNGTMVYIFTASDNPREHGLVYRACKHEEDRLHMGLKPSPFFRTVSLDTVFNTPGLQKYRKFVLREIKNFGISHPTIQSQYFGIWDAESGETFISMSELSKCRVDGLGLIPFTQEDCVCGIDTAKSRDSTVVEIIRVRDRRILNWLQLDGDNYPEQEWRVKEFLYNYNITLGRSDNTGNGSVFNDYLEQDTVHKCKDENCPGYGRTFKALPYIVRVNSGGRDSQYRDNSFNALRRAIVERLFIYPNVNSPLRKNFELQLISLIKRKVGDKYRIDHPKTGHSDYPDTHRYTLECLWEMTPDTPISDAEVSGISRKEVRDTREKEVDDRLIRKKEDTEDDNDFGVTRD